MSLWKRSDMELTKIKRGSFQRKGSSSRSGHNRRSNPCSNGCPFTPRNRSAKTFAERFRGVKGHPFEQGFDLRLWPERLELPLRWKEPRFIFVNSMSDLFHKDIPDAYIEKVF